MCSPAFKSEKFNEKAEAFNVATTTLSIKYVWKCTTIYIDRNIPITLEL